MGIMWMIGLLGCGNTGQETTQEDDRFGDIPENTQNQIIDLRTAYQESFPKYIKRGSEITGMCMDILRAIEEESGLRIGSSANDFTPFKRLQSDLENHKIDIFVGMKKTEGREKIYDFIDPPIYTVKSVVAVLAEDDAVISSIQDLYGQTVMIPHGSATATMLKTKHTEILVDEGGGYLLLHEKIIDSCYALDTKK